LSAAASDGAPARGALAVRLFACFALGYFMSYGLRSVNAVLAPELMADIGLTHAQLGSLSSAYFVAFALMQVPLGVWLDRFGPRRVNAVLMGVAALGCVGFALARSLGELWLARALVGAGVSAALMAALTAFRQWFEPAQQTRLAAWMLMAGTTGVLTTTVPVHAALPLLGWRGVFWLSAALLAAIGVAMWTLLPRGRETPAAAGGTSFAASLGGYGEVFRNGYFWRMSLTAGVVQGGFVAMQSLWVGPWMDRVLGFDGAARADRLFLFNLALMGAYLASAWWPAGGGAARGARADRRDRHRRRRRVRARDRAGRRPVGLAAVAGPRGLGDGVHARAAACRARVPAGAGRAGADRLQPGDLRVDVREPVGLRPGGRRAARIRPRRARRVPRHDDRAGRDPRRVPRAVRRLARALGRALSGCGARRRAAGVRGAPLPAAQCGGSAIAAGGRWNTRTPSVTPAISSPIPTAADAAGGSPRHRKP
jgi:MFS family permease